jgi:uncharacterized coiled-coil protein SlyX
MNSFSIYIPRLQSNVTEDFIKYVFRATNVGEVARVDFTPINKKPGFGENVDNVVKSAFVHFSFFTNISYTDPEFGNKVREGNGYKFYPETLQGYWLLLPAKNPIQQTMMNNSQIVENGRYLETKLEEQEAKLTEQADTIQELKKKLDGLQTVVYQLLGGLFNQNSQSEILEDHLSSLFSEPRVRNRNEDPDNSKWEFWPTTRQGDANEEKIENLQKEFNLLAKTVNNHAEKGSTMELRVYALEEQIEEMTTFESSVFNPDGEEEQDNEPQARKFVLIPYPMQQINDELTVSTHSSMPDLVEDSDSDYDSIPDLESVSSVDSREILRNSY